MIFPSIYRRPIFIVGNGVRESGACEALYRLYERTRIPVLTTMNTVDIMPAADRIGFIGVYGNRVANIIVEHSDLVIAVGARLGLRQIGNKREFFAPSAHLIRVDIDENELSRDIKDDEDKILMDAGDFFKELSEEEIPVYSEWNEKCFEAAKVLSGYDKEYGNLCIEKIAELLPEDPVVAVDVGQNQCWTAQSLTLRGRSGRILIGGSYGSMGCGLPYAIGASIYADNGPVFCITGDGGMQMNIQELQTVSSERLPIKIFVLNNRSLGKISEIQRGSYDNRMFITTQDSGYSVPDFSSIASAYGIKAKNIDSYEELDECRDWIEDDEPCLIDIAMPDDTLLLPKMNWNQKEMQPALSAEIMEKVRGILCD